MAAHQRMSFSVSAASPLCRADSDVMDDEPGGATATRKWMSPPCRRCRVERCNFAASYQLSASVHNIVKANQCYIKHYINVRAAESAGLDVVTLCCLSSWITRPDPQILLLHGKSASFVYLQGWVISNNHSSQDRVPRLSLSSRSSLALKCDLNMLLAHTPASLQSSADRTAQ